MQAHSQQGIDHLLLDGCNLFGELLVRDFVRGLLLLDQLQLFVQMAHLFDHFAHPLDVPVLVDVGVIPVGFCVLDYFFDPNFLLSQLVT